ncbi:hypothetical protein [Paenibacillus montanisoli]|uniref:Sporulation membrane protein YtrI C-terminal domain-containing protein n=1 Tax=Paenibacillus montanisoli TaxID=2081970 RepID=A0A328TYA9_9BACL|nr:hypothetical protein [Paenibacillus montanisoli]RAP75497.1 hypothetical protein DL346_19350 [Paenibacillus montanisoli]
MRVPPFERYTRLVQAAAYIVLGAILGAMAYHAVFFMNFNALRDSYTSLEDKLNEYEDRIEKLNKFRDQHTVIQSILPILLDSKDPKWPEITDESVKSALKAKLKKDLDALVGTSIYKINANAELAWKLLDGKMYTIEGNKEFTVEIRTILVVDNVLQVWFRAKAYDRPIN